jgi:hypothetical protein
MATTYVVAAPRAGVASSVVQETTARTYVTPSVVLKESASATIVAGPRQALIM